MLTLVHKVIHLVVLAHLQMECLFSIAPDANSWWLAHLSKGEEVRVEMELVEMMLASVY